MVVRLHCEDLPLDLLPSDDYIICSDFFTFSSVRLFICYCTSEFFPPHLIWYSKTYFFLISVFFDRIFALVVTDHRPYERGLLRRGMVSTLAVAADADECLLAPCSPQATSPGS